MASGAAYGIGGGAAVDADARAVQSGPEDADGVVGSGAKVVEVIGALPALEHAVYSEGLLSAHSRAIAYPVRASGNVIKRNVLRFMVGICLIPFDVGNLCGWPEKGGKAVNVLLLFSSEANLPSNHRGHSLIESLLGITFLNLSFVLFPNARSLSGKSH